MQQIIIILTAVGVLYLFGHIVSLAVQILRPSNKHRQPTHAQLRYQHERTFGINNEGRREWIADLQRLPCKHTACAHNCNRKCLRLGCRFEARG